MDTVSTKFLLDSGDPNEYREIAMLAKKHGNELWGSTTNPSLIAKKLAGEKISQEKAFALQKEIVLEILSIVPGAVSAEVYADEKTTATEMIEQGRDIATWHPRVVVKLPTTLEGFKARTTLRTEKIPVNNTLVFSQEQVFAICLHEQIIQQTVGPTNDLFPPFISPFVGRLDDLGLHGMDLVNNSMKIKKLFKTELPKTGLAIWMLEASVRSIQHIQQGIATKTELITGPAKLYQQWFTLSRKEQELTNEQQNNLKEIEYWTPPQNLFNIDSIEKFMHAIENGTLSISHPLTDKGITLFATDWKNIIAS